MSSLKQQSWLRYRSSRSKAVWLAKSSNCAREKARQGSQGVGSARSGLPPSAAARRMGALLRSNAGPGCPCAATPSARPPPGLHLQQHMWAPRAQRRDELLHNGSVGGAGDAPLAQANVRGVVQQGLLQEGGEEQREKCKGGAARPRGRQVREGGAKVHTGNGSGTCIRRPQQQCVAPAHTLCSAASDQQPARRNSQPHVHGCWCRRRA